MKRIVLLALMLVGILGSVSAQHDDMYFVPKKKVKTEAVEEKANEAAGWSESLPLVEEQESEQTLLESASLPVRALEMDEDTYNRRGSYLTEQGDAVSEFAMDDEGFVLITEEGDTMLMNTDTLKLTRVQEDEGWVNGFEGSDSDYEYAMRIVRFRNPRYAIPVSSPLYWDVVYGGALWPSWDWNIYDDGMYAYVFPTTSNWLYWDYRISYPFGWSPWGSHWNHHWGWHYGHHWAHHWGGFYGSIWYDPWYDPYFYGYHPGWHHHHGHHGFYPGIGKPGWGGGKPGSRPPRDKHIPSLPSVSRQSQRGSTSASRSNSSSSVRNSSVRVVTGRSSSSAGRSSGAVRSSSSSRAGNDEVVRRSTGTSTGSRGTATSASSRSNYTRQSSSRSSSGTSYNRPSSTRSSSSSMSRSSSSSSSSSYSSGASSSSRGSSYSSGSSSRSSGSYSSGNSYSSGSSYSSSSRSSGSSYSGGSRSSGGSYSGGSRSSGSRR